MKAKQLDELLSELKSLRKKVLKSAQAHQKVEHQLAQVEAVAKLLRQHLEEVPKIDRPADKLTKKEKKKVKKDNAESEPPMETNTEGDKQSN